MSSRGRRASCRRQAVRTAIADISDRDQVDAAFASTSRVVRSTPDRERRPQPNAPTWEYPPDDGGASSTSISERSIAAAPRRSCGRTTEASSRSVRRGERRQSTPLRRAAKAGIIALTSRWEELASQNVAVNCGRRPPRARGSSSKCPTHPYMLSKIPRGASSTCRSWRRSSRGWSEENSFSTGAVWDLSGGRRRTDGPCLRHGVFPGARRDGQIAVRPVHHLSPPGRFRPGLATITSGKVAVL